MFSRCSRIAAAGGLSCVVACAAALLSSAPLPVSAQAYVPPKIITRADTTATIPGSGTIVVQVEVFADGTHRVEKLVDADNPGDIPAALDIAKNSTYAPAERDGKPVTSYYDFTLRFTGKSIGVVEQAAVNKVSTTGSGDAQAEQMIKTGNYSGAEARLQGAIQRDPNNTAARELLGLAYYYQKNFIKAAAAYQQVSTIDKTYVDIAAQSFSSASLSYSTGSNGVAVDLSLAQQYAQRAVQLSPQANMYFSLGVVQLKNKDTADAVVNLKKARDLGFANPTTDAASKANLDGALLQAYTQAGDLTDAQLVSDEILKLDPKSTLPGQLLGQAYFQAGYNDVKAKQTDAAVTNFEKAASYGNPQISAMAYSQAAFAEANSNTPDYTKVKGYADKALAADPNNPLANWAEGVAYTGQYAASQRDDLKKQAQAYCAKASALAKAQGNASLAAQIDKYVEVNLK